MGTWPPKNAKSGETITGKVDKSAFFAGKVNGQDCHSKGKWVIQKYGEQCPWIKAREYGFISDIPYQFEITLFEDNPRIECKVDFDLNGQKIGMLSDNLRDSHSPFVHEEKLRFKFFPKIEFRLDTSLDYSEKINSLLKEVKDDLERPSEDDSEEQ